MSLFLLQNSISSRQVYLIATLFFEGFLFRLFNFKQSYTAQKKLHKFLNIWGKLKKNSLRFVPFFSLSLIVILSFKPGVVLFVAVNFIYILKHEDNCYHYI